MVVYNSLKASILYEKIFDLQRIEVTALARGEHEVIFSLYDVRFHKLDENPQFGLKAPDFRKYRVCLVSHHGGGYCTDLSASDG